MSLNNSINGKNIVVQHLYATITTSALYTAYIPYDNTIPQKTEGQEIITLSITPKSATNILVIDWDGAADPSGGQGEHTIALFQDDTSNALCAVPESSDGGAPTKAQLVYIMAAGTTSSTTFKIRQGALNEPYSVLGAFFNTARYGVLRILEITN